MKFKKWGRQEGDAVEYYIWPRGEAHKIKEHDKKISQGPGFFASDACGDGQKREDQRKLPRHRLQQVFEVV